MSSLKTTIGIEREIPPVTSGERSYGSKISSEAVKNTMSLAKQRAILVGLALGLCLIHMRDRFMPSVSPQPVQAGTMNVAINPKHALMFRPSKKSVTLRLGESAPEKLHLDVNSVSAWQLMVSPSVIKDAATQKSLEHVNVAIGVNGGEMRPIGEKADIIASGMPLEKGVDLMIGVLPKKFSLPLDLPRAYECDLTFTVIGVF